MTTYTQTLSVDTRYSITLQIEETDLGLVRTLYWSLTATKTGGTGYYSLDSKSPCAVNIDGESVFNGKVSYDFRGSIPKTITLASGYLSSTNHTFVGLNINVSAYFNAYPNNLGEATINGTFTLNTLHTNPSDITYTMVETNNDLINANVGNNVFVKDLSIKQFQVSATFYDGATLDTTRVWNGALGNISTSSVPDVVILDFSQIALQTNENNKAPIVVNVIDNMGGGTLYPDPSTPDLYDTILYNKVTLIDSDTYVKRKGQTSGRVNVNIKGTYFNGEVGNINQGSTYKPTIKYKFWKVGTSEPSTYNYTIPSSDITINNGTYSVTNYDIGSSTESDVNYFDPNYAYRIKFQVSDNFSDILSAEKQVPVGEATWTEYRDRVDFKKITIKGENPFEYSTNENIVGIFDGETLYRKVIKETLTPTANSETIIPHNISNIDEIKSIKVIYKLNWAVNDEWGSEGYLSSAGITTRVNKTNIILQVGANVWNGDYVFTIEYTKSS